MYWRTEPSALQLCVKVSIANIWWKRRKKKTITLFGCAALPIEKVEMDSGLHFILRRWCRRKKTRLPKTRPIVSMLQIIRERQFGEFVIWWRRRRRRCRGRRGRRGRRGALLILWLVSNWSTGCGKRCTKMTKEEAYDRFSSSVVSNLTRWSWRRGRWQRTEKGGHAPTPTSTRSSSGDAGGKKCNNES